MNVSYQWLRSIAPDLADAPHALAERLAAYGAAVDEIVDIGEALGDIVIARVLDAGRHPNADRLTVCVVDAGGAGPLQVVCGAPNVRAGAFYPFVPAGGTLPGGMKIRRTKIRGEESNGMLCSARELGLGRDHEGILELHGAFEPGAAFLDAVGLRDTRLVIDVTPNRPDLLSHWGVAREVAPGGTASLRMPPFPSADADVGAALRFAAGTPAAHADGIDIRLEDAHGCPRYYGVAIRGVRVAPSPEWLAARLRAIGSRPINNVVDATNWILHELGQPLHAFDLGRLGSTIVVRRARTGETLVTLDGVTRRLDPGMLVIADASRPVALAGVMGGEATEVSADTTDVLLECALFDPRITRETRKRAGLSTDASQRYERGVDPDMMERALRRAVQLIVTVAGGTPGTVAPLADAGVPPAPPVELRTARVSQVLGIDLTADAIADLLRPIGFEVTPAPERLTVRVPGHRRYDVTREDDLVEEVARRHGFDRFPDDLRPFRPSVVPDDAVAILENALRETLVGLGFLESRTAPFAPESAGSVELLLPLSAAESRLRSDLVTGLLRRVEANFNRGARAIRLFEIGTVFAQGGADGLPHEETRLALVVTGPRQPRHWSGTAPAVDLWDLRGFAETLAERLDLDLRPGFDAHPWVPGESWQLAAGDTGVGGAGRVRDGAVDAPPWADPVFALEIRLTPPMTAAEPVRVRALPAHPSVERDIALLLPAGLAAGAVRASIRDAAGPLLEDVSIFDVYDDEKLGAGRRSVAFRMCFRAPDRTLVDTDVDDAVTTVLRTLQEEHRVERRA